MKNYIETNKNLWNKKTEVHVNSEFYDLDAFRAGKSSLNPIELELLGELKGKSILHLQCHFGQDSISLARLGGEVVGVDLADKAVEFAKELAKNEKANAEFICCDLYELPKLLTQKFNMVFTSYGTIGWLPDLDKWASVISHFLKPGGEFIFVEFHPFIWMLDDDFKEITYRYFKDKPIIETKDGTYTDQKYGEEITSVSWNHALSEVLSALLKSGLTINQFSEFDYSPYNIYSKMKENAPGVFRFEQFANKIPMVYSLKAKKPFV